MVEWLGLEGNSVIIKLQLPCPKQGHRPPYPILDQILGGFLWNSSCYYRWGIAARGAVCLWWDWGPREKRCRNMGNGLGGGHDLTAWSLLTADLGAGCQAITRLAGGWLGLRYNSLQSPKRCHCPRVTCWQGRDFYMLMLSLALSLPWCVGWEPLSPRYGWSGKSVWQGHKGLHCTQFLLSHSTGERVSISISLGAVVWWLSLTWKMEKVVGGREWESLWNPILGAVSGLRAVSLLWVIQQGMEIYSCCFWIWLPCQVCCRSDMKSKVDAKWAVFKNTSSINGLAD